MSLFSKKLTIREGRGGSTLTISLTAKYPFFATTSPIKLYFHPDRGRDTRGAKNETTSMISKEHVYIYLTLLVSKNYLTINKLVEITKIGFRLK